MPRWQFAMALGLAEIGGTHLDLAAGDRPRVQLVELTERLLGAPPSPELQGALSAAIDEAGSDSALASVMAAGLIASPQFQWR